MSTCLGAESHGDGELGVVNHVAILAVHRHEVLRSQQLLERAQLALARVARGVDRLLARVDDLGRFAVQVVDHSTDRPLVARDRVRAEDHRVVGADLEVARVTSRQLATRRRAARPGSRCRSRTPAGREPADVLDVDDVGGVDAQQVELARELRRSPPWSGP